MQKVSVATFQSDSSDSEDYQPLNIISARLPIEVLARHEERLRRDKAQAAVQQ